MALAWANIDPHGYNHFVDYPVWFNNWIGADFTAWQTAYGDGHDAFAGMATRVEKQHN
ncbi:MAG: hypothetical protein AAFW64_03625 [Pseudomonadota bacterium]